MLSYHIISWHLPHEYWAAKDPQPSIRVGLEHSGTQSCGSKYMMFGWLEDGTSNIHKHIDYTTPNVLSLPLKKPALFKRDLAVAPKKDILMARYTRHMVWAISGSKLDISQTHISTYIIIYIWYIYISISLGKLCEPTACQPKWCRCGVGFLGFRAHWVGSTFCWRPGWGGCWFHI